VNWLTQGTLIPESLDSLPPWLGPLVKAVDGLEAKDLTQFIPQVGEGVHSAVLVLFGDQQDVLIIERATNTRSHSGQPAFPGGRVEISDQSAIAAALREANEETGLDPHGVTPFAQLPDLWITVSNYVVSPILGWWHEPSAISPRDTAEVASVHRIPIADFINPDNRVRIRLPSGYMGDAFEVNELLVWGFTGGLLSTLFELSGWSVPWDRDRVIDL
jgi:8-oxo-dGTP pyrophosphatase MutT (NUDIX family)